MLFRTLAVLAIAPAAVLSAPHGPTRRHGVIKRCKGRGSSATPSPSAQTAAVSLPASATETSSIVDTIPTSVANVTQVASTSVPTTEASSTADEPTSTKKSAKPTSTAEASSTQESTKESTKSSTKTSSASASASATHTPSSNIPSTNSLFSALLPMGQGSKLWSTAENVVSSAVSLSLDAFGAHDTMSRAPALFSTAPDGSDAMEVKFKKGSWTYKGPGPSALSFYGTPLDMSSAKEVTTSYQVFFPEGFAFNKGGKLPGLYGGDDADVAVSCSGGRRDTRCFSVRFMWRTDGAGELYTYLPDKSNPGFESNDNLCKDIGGGTSDCNSVYGASVGRGSFTFKTGAWTTLAQRVRLNDPGQSNGELELIVDGESKFTVNGLRFTDSAKARPVGLQAQSFFGGSTDDWASPKDQSLFMKNFNMVVTDEF